MSYAKATLIGNVGRDPEVKAVGQGEVCNFTLAVNKKVKGEKQTTWWTVSCWSERLTGIITEYVKKGTQVMVVGEPSARAYENKQNEIVAVLELNISFGDLVLLGGGGRRDEEDEASDWGGPRARPSSRARPAPRRAPAKKPAAKASTMTDEDMDDDIPF